MQPDISVVVPIYGVEKYLKQCVDSILNQTFKNMEVILVDDGSRDRCPQMVDEYAAQDARVVAIHQPNGGYGKAVNAGIARARGKYIGIIESDDWIAPDMYEKLFAQAEKTGAEITKGNFYWVTNSAKGEMFLFKPWTELAKCGEVFTLEEKPNLFMDHSSLWSALYRRDFWKSTISVFRNRRKPAIRTGRSVPTSIRQQRALPCCLSLSFITATTPTTPIRRRRSEAAS